MAKSSKTHFMRFPIFIRVLISMFFAWFCAAHAKTGNSYQLQESDIVFSSSVRGQGEAIVAATGSRHTHCGIVVRRSGRLMVHQAVQSVGSPRWSRSFPTAAPARFLPCGSTPLPLRNRTGKPATGRWRRSDATTILVSYGTTEICIARSWFGKSIKNPGSDFARHAVFGIMI